MKYWSLGFRWFDPIFSIWLGMNGIIERPLALIAWIGFDWSRPCWNAGWGGTSLCGGEAVLSGAVVWLNRGKVSRSSLLCACWIVRVLSNPPVEINKKTKLVDSIWRVDRLEFTRSSVTRARVRSACCCEMLPDSLMVAARHCFNVWPADVPDTADGGSLVGVSGDDDEDSELAGGVSTTPAASLLLRCGCGADGGGGGGGVVVLCGENPPPDQI